MSMATSGSDAAHVEQSGSGHHHTSSLVAEPIDHRVFRRCGRPSRGSSRQPFGMAVVPEVYIRIPSSRIATARGGMTSIRSRGHCRPAAREAGRSRKPGAARRPERARAQRGRRGRDRQRGRIPASESPGSATCEQRREVDCCSTIVAREDHAERGVLDHVGELVGAKRRVDQHAHGADERRRRARRRSEGSSASGSRRDRPCRPRATRVPARRRPPARPSRRSCGAPRGTRTRRGRDAAPRRARAGPPTAATSSPCLMVRSLEDSLAHCGPPSPDRSSSATSWSRRRNFCTFVAGHRPLGDEADVARAP